MIKNKNSKLFIYINIISIFWTILHMYYLFIPTNFLEFITTNKYLLFVYSSFMIITVGWHFIMSAWKSITISKSMTMDTLVALGIILSYVYSNEQLWILDSKHLFFETTISLIAFINIGRIIEDYTVNKSNNDLNYIENLQPQSVFINNQEVPVDEVNIGQIITIKSGSVIPLNGNLVSKTALIDASNITGESLEVQYKQNDEMLSGMLNTGEDFDLVVTKSLEDSSLQKIIESVYMSQFEAPDIQKNVDKIAKIFIPLILLISIISLLTYGIIINNWYLGYKVALTVIIISCPCALGLATPISILLGVLRGQKLGILYKDANTFEKFQESKVFVFDKTGTLTQNQAQIIDQFTQLNDNENQIIYSIQKQATHPLSKAFIQNQDIQDLKLDNVVQIPGVGVSYNEYLICSQKHLNSLLIKQSKEQLEFVQKNNGSIVYFIKNNQILNIYCINDALKSDAKELINYLQSNNYLVYILSGDRKEEVLRISQQLNIDSKNVKYEVNPHEKEDFIKQLKNKYQNVTYVGDGINDIAALSYANFGISFSHGFTKSVNNSDITLVGEELHTIKSAINLTKKTIRNIKINIGWAFLYNIIAIPLAVMGQIKPMYSAIFMSFSSIIVTLNSLRLMKTKI